MSETKDARLRYEDIHIEDLRPHPLNYRSHPEDQLAHIRASAKAHGVYRNVVVARDNTVLAGHGVVEACRQLGYATVPCVRVDVEPDSVRALKILTGDNTIAHLAQDDQKALVGVLKDVESEGLLLGTGYDEPMLSAAAMVAREASELKPVDHDAEWRGMPAFEAESPALKLSITFATKAEREAFVRKHGIVLLKAGRASVAWSGWWPAKGREDPGAVEFQA